MTDGAELDEFSASLRKRKRIAGGIAAAVVVAIVAAVLIVRAGKLPSLDPETVADVREALDSIPPQYRAELAAKAFAELEGERLPAALVEAFDDLGSMPPGMGDLILLAPFSDDEETLKTWLLACPDGADALAEVAEQGGGAEALYERCELERLGLLGPTELGGVSVGELVATHAAWAHLVEHRSETDLERRVLRTLMGRS